MRRWGKSSMGCYTRNNPYLLNMKNFSFKLLLVLAVTFVSCSPESDLTPESQIGVQFHTVHSDLSTQANSKDAQLKSASGSLTFTTGYIAIGKLEFEAEADNDSIEIEFELEQNTIIDFATGFTTPDISNIYIPAGTYEEVEVEIELREESEEPAILLYGTYTTPDGVQHDIRFEFSSEESFEVEREGVILLEEHQVAVAEITFDPVAWFAEVTDENLENATKETDGTIVVSSSQNVEIYGIVADGLELASEMEMKDDEDEDEEEDVLE